jgi:transcriptional regulator with XRE-family HTH domain
MHNGKIDFGSYIHQLRIEHQYSLKKVADKLDVDISLLSKIEHGERQVQGHMLKPLAELFNLDYKEIQIQFLNQKIETDYGNEPYFIESIEQYLNNFSKKNK